MKGGCPVQLNEAPWLVFIRNCEGIVIVNPGNVPVQIVTDTELPSEECQKAAQFLQPQKPESAPKNPWQKPENVPKNPWQRPENAPKNPWQRPKPEGERIIPIQIESTKKPTRIIPIEIDQKTTRLYPKLRPAPPVPPGGPKVKPLAPPLPHCPQKAYPEMSDIMSQTLK